MVEFIETTTFSVAVISTGSMTTAIYTFGTAPTSFVFTKLAKSNYLLDLITAWAPASLAAGTRNGEHDT